VVTRVGDGVRVAAGKPFGIAGLEVAGHGALAFYVASDVEVADSDQQVWALVMVFGNNSAGLQFELGDAHAVFYEQNFLSAS